MHGSRFEGDGERAPGDLAAGFKEGLWPVAGQNGVELSEDTTRQILPNARFPIWLSGRIVV